MKAGKELTPLRSRTYWHGAKCSVMEDGEPCGRDIVARGYCGKHFQRWNKDKDGDPAVKRERPEREPATCSECDRPVHARGYCSSHHAKWRKHGDPNFVPPLRERPACSECDRPARALGYCTMHYRRFKVHGDPSIVLPPSNAGHRKYSLNEDYFKEIATPEQAYWLGFLTADGSITGDDVHGWGLSLELAERDAAHVHKFACAIGTDSPVNPSGQGCVRIRLNSQHLVRTLADLGVIQRKSLIVEPPLERLRGLEPFYWRGLWDGDGWVSSRKDRGAGWNIGICGSYACVHDFAIWGRGISGGTAQPSNKTSKNPEFWKWAVAGTRKARLLAEQLRIAGAGFGLDRKQILLEEICIFDLDKYEADLNSARAPRMRAVWATGKHPRAKRAA